MQERTAILIAEVLLDGPFTESAVRKRLARLFQANNKADWPRKVFAFAKAKATDHSGQLVPPKLVRSLIDAVEISGVNLKATRHLDAIAKQLHPTERPVPRMLPVSVCAAKWSVPAITTSGQLSDLLSIPLRQLEWFADVDGREASETKEQFRHYRSRWISKPNGGTRLLETPKPKLKTVQRAILSQILNHIPAHPAAHGFVKGKSCLTASRLHTGKQVVLRIDLRHFFPSVHVGRVAAIFRSAGYPQAISSILSGLCTHTTSRRVLQRLTLPPTITHRFHDPATRHFLVPHLPQGSPTSPALANLAASKLDARLAGLASAFNATYTRYADDLVFSGNHELSQGLGRAKIWICAICLDEGFQIQHRKTTIQRQHQQQRVHGIVVNSQSAVGRRQRDELKAILHNCIRQGPAVNNHQQLPDFRAHLQGRISMITATCSDHGDKLRKLFQQIAWND